MENEELLEAMKIYQSKHGGSLVEISILFVNVTAALREAAQQSTQADEGYECHCNAEHAHMTYIAHEEGCPARLRR